MMRVAIVLSWMSIAAVALSQTFDSRLDVLRSDPSSTGFAQASQPRVFEFPQDHGPHPDFRHEWWYVTGHLDAANGERFGFELTFFRYALAPPGASTQLDGSSAWRTNQIYLAHFAVTDLERHEFYFTERYAREALGLAGARSAPPRVWLEDWRLELSEGKWTLQAASERYRIHLDLQPLLAPLLNGDRGLSRKSQNAASYYYSIPRITVRGELVRQTQEPLKVSGLAWLDREWGSGALAADQQGWDWFALQLDEGSTLMFYSLRRLDGSRDPHSAGTWVTPDGHARPLENEEVQLRPLEQWISPCGGAYPTAWQLRVPALDLDLTVRPLLADQELATSPRYWEGAVAVEGRHGARKTTGQGYLELVGYADGRTGLQCHTKVRHWRDMTKGRSP